MKQLLIKDKRIQLQSVSKPVCAPGNILVRVRSSCLSPGTEYSTLKNTGLSSKYGEIKTKNGINRIISFVKKNKATIFSSFIVKEIENLPS